MASPPSGRISLGIAKAGLQLALPRRNKSYSARESFALVGMQQSSPQAFESCPVFCRSGSTNWESGKMKMLYKF